MAHLLIASDIFEAVAEAFVDDLIRAGHKVTRSRRFGRTGAEDDGTAHILPEVEAVLLGGGRRMGADAIRRARRLRVISLVGVGYEGIDLEAATEQGVLVTSTPGVNAASVADFTFGLILTLARRILESDRDMKAGRWVKLLGADVSGKTLGVVGLGAIGREVVKRARGFDMRVLAYSRTMDPQRLGEGVEPASLEALFRESDFVSLHVPLTPETRGMIDRRLLSLMKPTAFLINTARAAVVDQQALYEALTRRSIAGAAIDVYEKEPPVNDPLPLLDNVIATPHVAAFSEECLRTTARRAVENALTVLRGHRPAHVLNPRVLHSLDPAGC